MERRNEEIHWRGEIRGYIGDTLERRNQGDTWERRNGEGDTLERRNVEWEL